MAYDCSSETLHLPSTTCLDLLLGVYAYQQHILQLSCVSISSSKSTFALQKHSENMPTKYINIQALK